MKRNEAISCVLSLLKREVVVAANGMISREAHAARDRTSNFYMLGSMGLASSIALGIAVNKPSRKVVVLDGDGNVLMGLGALAMAGNSQPKNLVHFVFDNERYESTGGQPSISNKIDLDKIALASGYKQVFKVCTIAELKLASKHVLANDGLSFVVVKVSADDPKDGARRVSQSPIKIANRFIASVNL